MKTKIALYGLAVLVVVGIASALIVSYLSNSVTTSTAVSSPLVLAATSPTDITAFGGESKIVTYTVTNQANAEISGDFNLNVSNPDGLTCSDFSDVRIDGVSIYASCSVVDPNKITLSGVQTYSALATPTVSVNYTFVPAAMGNYSTEAQVLT